MSPGVTLHKVPQRLLLAAFGPINVRTQVKDRLVKRDEAVTIYTKRKSRLKSTLTGAGPAGVSHDAPVFAFRSYTRSPFGRRSPTMSAMKHFCAGGWDRPSAER